MDGVAVEPYSRTPPLASTEPNMATLPPPQPREPSEKRELPHHPMLSTAALLNPIIEKTPPPVVEEPRPMHPHTLPQILPQPQHQPQSHQSYSNSHSLSRSPVDKGPSASTTPPLEPTNGPVINDMQK
ncbi:uncharacterized protein TRIVIDRAFT_227867 [Trichoderma virens Gv29-8]|uniref:Uncharacterized protein n=1 Tax=Hypocrea virens (strain Gv29-8 / FGSC 10586) TaxID=413071 RepID=G9NAS0_HYPVG|nr:uncharacterized protein TRIVIDRAFT_227867 [Trichoderma virens Gv29-8]EHK15931.1 hypothetical protein TRIVIDRAFT_227867 [Trichoderma virens Gv29-8]UKZ56296.1 hypothetical protein TrVGV298_010130 [Trichoderma virens]